MTVGLDGAYVGAAYKEGFFEVIAGGSVVAFRRREEDSVPPPKCFGLVQSYDSKTRRRLWELMKSRRMEENQEVVFLSDGARTSGRSASICIRTVNMFEVRGFDFGQISHG
jgi:hypothetical protein